jgi:hypothetical protein
MCLKTRSESAGQQQQHVRPDAPGKTGKTGQDET